MPTVDLILILVLPVFPPKPAVIMLTKSFVYPLPPPPPDPTPPDPPVAPLPPFPPLSIPLPAVAFIL